MPAKKKKEIKLSATRINTFLQCKQKYYFNYVEHLPKLSNPVFRLGLACHEALELAGEIWMEKGKFTAKDKKVILKRYEEIGIREGIMEMDIHVEGKALVSKRINDFALGEKIIGTETPFGFAKENDIKTDLGVPLIGAIDKVVEVDEDTLLIVDYKTSKTAPTPDQLKTDHQLSMYDLVAHMLWPGYKRIIVSLDLLKHEILYSYRTEEERAEFNEYLKEIYDQMSSFTKKQAKPSLNTFCGWCDFKEHCDAYKKACSNTDYPFKDTSLLDAQELLDEWQHVRATKKALEMRERELNMLMMDKIKIQGETIKTDDMEVYIRQSARKNYDLDVVSSSVPVEHFPSLVKLNKKAVENYISKNPAVKDKIMDSTVVNFTTPFLATKKIKPVKKDKN